MPSLKTTLYDDIFSYRNILLYFQLRLHQRATEMKLQPFAFLLRSALDQLVEVDTSKIFCEPVDREEVFCCHVWGLWVKIFGICFTIN